VGTTDEGLGEAGGDTGDGVPVADGEGSAVIGADASPGRGAPSAASVKRARAFQIIQPTAPLSRSAFISASIWAAVYGGKGP
jgi:hypothetical protein